MRYCEVGEIFINQRCVKCKKNYYSFNPADKECKRCDNQGVKCLGGANIHVLPGYWMSNNITINAIKCLKREAC